MNIITLTKMTKKKDYYITIIVFLSLFFPGNLSYGTIFTGKYWHNNLIEFFYDVKEDAININFEFFDYALKGSTMHGYIEYCNFEYSTDGKRYFLLMKASTDEQSNSDYSWIKMTDKLEDADMYFILPQICSRVPKSMNWEENSRKKLNVVLYPTQTKVWLNMIWKLDSKYQNITHLRVTGRWRVAGTITRDYIENIYTIAPQKLKVSNSSSLNSSPSLSKTSRNTKVSKFKPLKVFKEAEEIVIEAAQQGENIDIYSTSGALINSSSRK